MSMDGLESPTDLQSEVFEVSEAKCNAFDDFDFVVDAFNDAGVDGEIAVSQDAVSVIE